MRLADFILSDMESILVEWEAFAATLLPGASNMTPLALRDHAEQILEAMVKDLSTSQTKQAQVDKSRGKSAKIGGRSGDCGTNACRPAGAKQFQYQPARGRISRAARQRPSPMERSVSAQ